MHNEEMKVLIAEDTPMLQEMVAEYMDCFGYDFDMASNGQEAVNLAKSKRGRIRYLPDGY